ncbi:MAG: pseudouridine synthase [Candidatus Kapabacteria bacterium]|nr:pseudouridine synthase [Candidatus Kapabacteria bacterium]
MKTKKDKKEGDGLIRLNKYISDAGYCSRRKADELIAAGVVKVNGRIIIDLGTKIATDANVTVNGDPIFCTQHYKYIVLNKPKDYITTTSDERGRKTVMELVNVQTRVFPVGRLDRNTTGVLFFTNDGELANRLMHPKYHIERIYVAGLDKPIDLRDAQKIAEGVELDDGKTAPCEVFVNPKDHTEVTVALTEGKNREVRRMFEAFGYDVKKLHRRFFANLSVSGMQRGDFRYLERKEILELKKIVGMR